jgi:hypothetical protein
MFYQLHSYHFLSNIVTEWERWKIRLFNKILAFVWNESNPREVLIQNGQTLLCSGTWDRCIILDEHEFECYSCYIKSKWISRFPYFSSTYIVVLRIACEVKSFNTWTAYYKRIAYSLVDTANPASDGTLNQLLVGNIFWSERRMLIFNLKLNIIHGNRSTRKRKAK